MREKNDAFEEVLRRTEDRKRRKEKNRMKWIYGCAGAMTVLILALALLPPVHIDGKVDQTMGSFLLNAEAGGYILVGVIALGIGAFITLLCVRKAKKNQFKKQNGGRNDEDKSVE